MLTLLSRLYVVLPMVDSRPTCASCLRKHFLLQGRCSERCLCPPSLAQALCDCSSSFPHVQSDGLGFPSNERFGLNKAPYKDHGVVQAIRRCWLTGTRRSSCDLLWSTQRSDLDQISSRDLEWRGMDDMCITHKSWLEIFQHTTTKIAKHSSGE